MKSAAEIQSALKATTDQLDSARRMVTAGHAIDLSDLSGQVETICRAITPLPAAERSKLEGPIVSLIDELDKLSKTLNAHRDGLKQGLKAISVRHQASSAYGQATQNRPK